MRTDVELLKILLANIDKLESGLCILIDDLEVTDIIGFDESLRLRNIIQKHTTRRYRHTGSLFYFKRGKRFIRRLYLIKLILIYTWQRKTSAIHAAKNR